MRESIPFEGLPSELPVFPLTGVLLLPRGHLPLNIFEPRYLAMVDDAMSSHRMIGMIQPQEDGTLYKTGCAGRIFSYHETPDGRIEIILEGVCRFRIADELAQIKGYRRVRADWSGFAGDMDAVSCLDIDRAQLRVLLKAYFEKQGLSCSWDAVDGANDDKLITTLAMVCPFEPKAKQALLESACCRERARLFMTLLEMECGGSSCKH